MKEYFDSNIPNLDNNGETTSPETDWDKDIAAMNDAVLKYSGLAQAYIPYQNYEGVMDMNTGLKNGTVFAELVSTYKGNSFGGEA